MGTLAALPDTSKGGHLGSWLLAFLSYLFDLAAGPEIVQALMHLATETRPLNDEEIAAAEMVLGPAAIRYAQVRLATGGVLDIAFQLNKNRAFATWHTVNLPDIEQEDLPLLIHELTHVYQYERVGSVYIGQGLWVQARLGRKAYDYGGQAGLRVGRAAGKRYCDYNREQQGQIAQDYCALLRAGQDSTAYEPFIAELQAGII